MSLSSSSSSKVTVTATAVAVLATVCLSTEAFVIPEYHSNAGSASSAGSRVSRSSTLLHQSSRLYTPIEDVISATTSGLMDEDSYVETRVPKRERIVKEPALWEYNFGLQDPGLKMPHGIVKDVTLPEKFEVTEEQIETLERDGVLHLKGVFDEEWVDYLRQATAYQVDEPHFWAFAGTASKLYDYIQRNVWQTNSAFARFYYHSAMGHVLAQCGRTDEIRVSTDLLMVNPNKGFKWHQDNQNGPITWDEGIRFWITMDETPKEYGAPVYLKGSHENDVVDDQAVFVDIEQNGLEDYKDKLLEFRTMPGDMLIWHPRTIHKVDGPADGIWTSYRRVLGGTAAKGGSQYHDKRGSGGVLSDLGRHGLTDSEPLKSSFFPIVYPQFDKAEAAERDSGKVGRNVQDIVTKIGGLATKASGERFGSFFKVLGSR
eukprot:CAMPEP_0113509306 /NCGR_PEP_ID=MMETSP0014_2-20120614/37499_1 /TAXON_ID=2857 /ORGANISM="Nitzschia sp." /LENGTH=429 /DNA_ID=CAMNT_0000405115 /DNA_START=245 /DNA_END=1537 /DNA_ORIENTATION=- /assembly_acc=CAM_ASM_000159